MVICECQGSREDLIAYQERQEAAILVDSCCICCCHLPAGSCLSLLLSGAFLSTSPCQLAIVALNSARRSLLRAASHQMAQLLRECRPKCQFAGSKPHQPARVLDQHYFFQYLMRLQLPALTRHYAVQSVQRHVQYSRHRPLWRPIWRLKPKCQRSFTAWLASTVHINWPPWSGISRA